MSFDYFPAEVFRYWRREINPVRVGMTVLVTSLFSGAAMFLGWSGLSPTWPSGVGTMLMVFQAAAVLVYGTGCAFTSIFSEKIERTWDFQRLTPQRAWQVVTGKILGSTLFAWVFFWCLIPWVALCLILSGGLEPTATFHSYAEMLTGAFFVLSLGVFGAAYYSPGVSDRVASSSSAIMGMVALALLWGRVAVGSKAPDIHFYGLRLETWAWTSLSAVLFGLWAFWGAVWRVGRDFSEPARFWRLPAFLVFLSLYLCGYDTWSGNGLYGLMAILSIPVYLAAALDRESANQGLGLGTPLDRYPIWIKAIAAAVLGIIVAIPIQVLRGQTPSLEQLLGPLVVLLFVCRDLCVIRYCRATASKRPEGFAVTLLLLLYGLPALLGLGNALRILHLLFFPVPPASGGIGSGFTAYISLVSSAVQAAIAAAWVVARISKLDPPRK